MDNKLFKAKLLEVAEVRELKPARNSGERVNDEITSAVVDGEEIVITQSYNPTLGLELVKLKQSARACELGCGSILTGQVIERRFCQTPSGHWRTRCANCGKYVHPNGEEFIEGAVKAGVIFYQHLTEKNK